MKTELLEEDTSKSGKNPNLVDLYTSYAATSGCQVDRAQLD